MSCARQITGSGKKTLFLCGVSAALLIGCATPEERAEYARQESEAQAKYEASIPTCSNDKECQAKWAAARRWVLDYCGFKLQHITDDYMETFNSGDYAATEMWCRVTKSPTSETAYRIELENGVNNPFGAGGLSAARWQFNQAVNAAWSTTP